MKAGAIVLAGGMSRRLRQDKTRLRIRGRTLPELIISQLRQLSFPEIILVFGSQPGSLNLPARETIDIFPGSGSLGGIYSGLFSSSFPVNFVIACDMPFPRKELIGYLLDLARPGDADCILPFDRGNIEPLFAVYRKSCLPAMKRQIEAKEFKISGILPLLKVRLVSETELDRFDPKRLSFFNINTPAELARAEELIDREQGKS